MKFEDNTDSVQTYTAGQQVPLYFNIRAPHSGYANVSIIDTTSNSMIAANLSAWDEYALTSIPAKTEWTVCLLLLPIYFLHPLTFFFLFYRTSQSPSPQTSEPNAQPQENAQFKCIGMPHLLSIRHIRVVLILLLVRAAAAMPHRRSEMSQRVLLLRGWDGKYLPYLEDEMR